MRKNSVYHKNQSFRAKKSMGQHFLLNVDRAVESVALFFNNEIFKNVLEIGPGLGALSKHLQPYIESHNILFSEIDKRAIAELIAQNDWISDTMFIGDFLSIDLQEHFKEETGIIGNFPYNISSQIIFRILEHRQLIPKMTGMFQREVAQRICGASGTRQCGILSVLVQTFYDTEYHFDLPPEDFNPSPKVWSAVISIKRKQKLAYEEPEFDAYRKFIKQCFQQKRKKLKNNIVLPKESESPELHALGDLRAEQLSINQFVELFYVLRK